MARDWEQQLREWGRAPGPAEQAKMEATEAQIRAALEVSAVLKGHKWQTAPQGSYYNLTHVPRESDVDIRVVSHDAIFDDWSWVDPRGNTDTSIRTELRKRYGLSSGAAAYGFVAFRDDVGAALVARFGPPPAVEPGDKAFRIRETRYHVDADVVAVLEHRKYRADGTWEAGVQFVTRVGKSVVNWPEQQHRNGIEKNKKSGERFKAMVRALKNLRIEMEDQGKAEAKKPISSFLVECLVWNVPDVHFNHTTYYDDMKEVLRFLYHNTSSIEKCSEWREESDLKWLFKGEKGWTRDQVKVFVLAAWSHVGFKD
jgi:hypothetical protein